MMNYVILNGTTTIANKDRLDYGVINIDNEYDTNTLLDMYTIPSPIKDIDSISNRAFGIYTIILKHYNLYTKFFGKDNIFLVELDWSFPPIALEVTRLLKSKNILVCHLYKSRYTDKITCHYICEV